MKQAIIDDLFYMLTAILVGLALALNAHPDGKRPETIDTKMPDCYDEVCFS